jgi:hypothetical protein
MRVSGLALLLLCMPSSGCAVHELHKDHDQLRSTLLDLYTNQIIDNLVRASKGLPIIQLDYSNVNAQVTIKRSASMGDSLGTTRSTVLTKAAALTSMVTRTTINTAMGSLSADNSNQVTLSASPVTTINEVYDAYLAFLTLPGSLQSSCDPPPPGVALVCKKYDHEYYFVPTDFRREFLRLSLLTTAQRGKSMLPPDDFFDVTIVAVGAQKVLKLGAIETYVTLAKPVPNDNGQIELTFGKEKVVFDTGDYNPEEAVRPPETQTIRIFFNPAAKNLPNDIKSPTDLKLPLTARLMLRGARPQSPPSTNQLLDRIQFQLQQIQFNQTR